MNWADQEYAIVCGIAAIRHYHNHELQPFVRGVIELQLPDLLAQGTESTFANVSAKQLATVPFPKLSEDEQRRIAHIHGTLDDKIELNRGMSETLEAMAQTLYKSWFVDFDPVRAKAEGRPTGLPPNLDARFPDSFQETELGEIPEGREVGQLESIAEERRPSVKPGETAPSTPYIWLADMPQRSIGLTQWDTADGIESGKSAFKRGEILFGELRPYFHKVGIAPVDGVCSTDIVVAAAKSPEWFGFVLGHMSSREFVDYTELRVNRHPNATHDLEADGSVLGFAAAERTSGSFQRAHSPDR